MVLLSAGDLETPLFGYEDGGESVAPLASSRRAAFMRLLTIIGPGLVVCLADTDPGGLVMMAVDGSETGLGLLGLQVLLIPLLYIVQEMVVRLTISAEKGLVVQVQEEFGKVATGIFIGAMTFEGTIAMVGEFSGFVAAGEIYGVPCHWSCLGAGTLLITVVLLGTYNSIEKVGMFLGSFLCLFIVTVVMCQPPWLEVAENLLPQPTKALSGEVPATLIWANIGTVVTPWMLFYQGSAIVVKGVRKEDLKAERIDTVFGCIVTQVFMCCVLVTFATMMPKKNIQNLAMKDVFIPALSPLLGETLSMHLTAMVLVGTSLLSAMVISLGVAWNLTEIKGVKLTAQQATTSVQFRTFFISTVGFAICVVSSGFIGIVELNILVQMVDGVIMPLVVVYIFYLATSEKILSAELRVKGWYMYLVGTILAFCSVLALQQAAAGALQLYKKFQEGRVMGL